MYRIGFVVEQVLGHITYGQNLQKNVVEDSAIDASWALPTWHTKGVAQLIPNWTFRAGLQTRKMIGDMQRQAPLDALFFHTQVTAVFAQKWLNKIPSIISLDATSIQYDSLGEYYDHHLGPTWIEQWKKTIDQNCFGAAKHIVTWSEWTKQGLVEDYGVSSSKITVIPPGVNVAEWSGPQKRRPNDAEPVKILFVGGNFERKGGVILLEAFRALKREITEDKNGYMRQGIELHLATQSEVEPEDGIYLYQGMQPNSEALKRLYHECDIFCLPTYGDFLPMVLSEAAAAGLPAISTDVAAIPEIIQDQKTGFIVSVGDVLALKAALKNLIVNPDLRLQQGECAKEWVKTRYDARENALKLLKLLKLTAETNELEYSKN